MFHYGSRSSLIYYHSDCCSLCWPCFWQFGTASWSLLFEGTIISIIEGPASSAIIWSSRVEHHWAPNEAGPSLIWAALIALIKHVFSVLPQNVATCFVLFFLNLYSVCALAAYFWKHLYFKPDTSSCSILTPRAHLRSDRQLSLKVFYMILVCSENYRNSLVWLSSMEN